MNTSFYLKQRNDSHYHLLLRILSAVVNGVPS